jgi:hypothetical protein
MTATNQTRPKTPGPPARRIVRVGLVCVLLGVACGTSSSPNGFGDGGPSGSSSGANSGGGSGNVGGSGNSSGSSASSGSGSGNGSSSGATDSGLAAIPYGDGGSGSSSGAPGDDGGTCAIGATSVRITEVDVGGTIVHNEDEAALKPLVISPIPSGGSRLAWMGSDGMVHITQLDASDHVAGPSFGLKANDFSDLYADTNGGVLLLTRDAMGGGTLNCGSPTALCGTPPNPAIPCYEMYMVRFDCGAETWATQMTNTTAPYASGALFVWWYAHHGRIAWNGSAWAGYYGVAITIANGTCVDIHQGDSEQVVGTDGKVQSGGFRIGCSHSGYERVIWDPATSKFVSICKTDNNNRISLVPYNTIYPVDLSYSNLGNMTPATSGGYWTIVTNIRSGQPAAASGLADVHLLHFGTGAADKDIVLANDSGLNDRAPHLATYGTNRILAAWETSTAAGDLAPGDANRKLYVQAVNASTGATEGSPYYVSGVTGNRYHDFRAYPDGSVAYPAPGSSSSSVKIVRVLPCR